MSNIEELIETASNFCRNIDIYIMQEEKFCETINKELDCCQKSASKMREDLMKLSHHFKVNNGNLNRYYSDYEFSQWIDMRMYELWEEDQGEVCEYYICDAITQFKGEGIWEKVLNTYFDQAVEDYYNSNEKVGSYV